MKPSNILNFPEKNPKIEILSDESILISSGQSSLILHPDGHLVLKGKLLSIDADNIVMNAERVDIC